MQVIFLFFVFMVQSAFAVGPLETKVQQFEELSGLLQRYCINNPNSANVKVLINGTELSCNHLLVLANRLKSQIDDQVEDIQEACEQNPQPEASQLARQSAAAARQSVCRPQSTDTQCLTSFACSMASKIGSSIPIFGAPISGMVRSCRGNYSAGGCIASIAKGIFDSLWGLISSVWDIGRAAVRGVGEWLGVIERGENSTSERLMAAQRATRAYVSRFIRNPIQVLRESASAIFNGLKQAAMESYGCEQWADARRPFVSRCLRPMTNWNCASCQQKFQVFCGIAGMAIGEIPSALLTGGAAGIASRIARTAAAAIRANARVGRVSRGVAELLGRFRPPAGLSSNLERIAARTARVMTAAERRVIAMWERLKNSPASRAIARAARSVPAAEARRAMAFMLRPAAFYVDAIEAAARMGFRAGDEAVASVVGNSERALVRAGASSERVAGSLTEIERDLPAEAQAVSEVTANDLRNLAGDTVDIPDEVVEAVRIDNVMGTNNDLAPAPAPQTQPSSSSIVVSAERTPVSATRITEGGNVLQRAPAAEVRPFTNATPRNAVVSDVTTGRITVTSSEGEDLLRRLGGEHVSFQDREIILDVVMGGPRRATYFDEAGRFDDAFRSRYREFERRLNQNPDELARYRTQVEALSRERIAVGNQKTLEELNDIRNERLPVRDEAFDCANLSRLTPGAFPAAGGNCRRLKFDEDVNGRYCSCGGMSKTSFTWLVRCPTRATDYHALSTYVDELALPFDSAPEMCTRVNIPRGKECYIGPTSPTFAGFGGTTQILCEHRGPRAPRGVDGNPPTREQVAAYEAQLEDLRRHGIQFGDPAVVPVRWAPFSTFPEYQNIVERAARACTNVCDINELSNVQRQFESATAAIRARGNPDEIARLAVEQRNFDQYLRELREGRRTFPTSSDLSPDTPAPVGPRNPYVVESRVQLNEVVPSPGTIRIPVNQPVRAPDITLQVAGRLDDEGRVAAAERIIGNVSGNEQRRDVLIRAHNVAPEHGFNTYTPAELREKMSILRYNMSTEELAAYRRANGNRYPPEVFSQSEADEILRRGLAGKDVPENPADAFSEARSAAVRARELRGRQNVDIEQVRATTREAAQGYATEAARVGNAQFTQEAWRLYARAGDSDEALLMLQQGVRQGMTPKSVMAQMRQDLDNLNTQIARGSTPALLLERDTLQRIIREAPNALGLGRPAASAAVTPQPKPVPPQRQARLISSISPTEARKLANDYRLGQNGQTVSRQRAAELYYRAADGVIQREIQALRRTQRTNFMGDSNFRDAIEESLQSNGALVIDVVDDIHRAGGPSAVNSFLAENFDRFQERFPTEGARRNLRRLITHVNENYGSELYSPQVGNMRAWASRNADDIVPPAVQATMPEVTVRHVQKHVAHTDRGNAFMDFLVRERQKPDWNSDNIDNLFANPAPPLTAADRPFVTDRITSMYPDGVTPDDVLREYNRGNAHQLTRESGDPNVMPYEVEIGRNRYTLYVCTAPRCTVDGEIVTTNQVTTITPNCGPDIRSLLRQGRAKEILRGPGPITKDSFYERQPCRRSTL